MGRMTWENSNVICIDYGFIYINEKFRMIALDLNIVLSAKSEKAKLLVSITGFNSWHLREREKSITEVTSSPNHAVNPILTKTITFSPCNLHGRKKSSPSLPCSLVSPPSLNWPSTLWCF
eukprot:Lithocolla_globosa_v1_NODE_5655_length_1205_cov_7.223478.p2 type:complete len:120 gc:universal NODE_5655_length_1205_cov_7.223478:730-1089(+)